MVRLHALGMFWPIESALDTKSDVGGGHWPSQGAITAIVDIVDCILARLVRRSCLEYSQHTIISCVAFSRRSETSGECQICCNSPSHTHPKMHTDGDVSIENALYCWSNFGLLFMHGDVS